MATKKMAIIATKGALDMAYPPLILASTAAALDWEVQVFFTFYGLQLLRKDLSGISISPLANPAVPSLGILGVRRLCSPRSLIPIRGTAPRGTRDVGAKI
jgi:peroxiredoxin family protein